MANVDIRRQLPADASNDCVNRLLAAAWAGAATYNQTCYERTGGVAMPLRDGWYEELMATEPARAADWIGTSSPSGALGTVEHRNRQGRLRWSHHPLVAMLVTARRLALD
ncbi:hypothetical protein CKO31_20275 [Thiohalocapsa halophila]|uniref:Transposase n=1 Tax=Thiohalocapsa halophila TaxID=69359 RepID=A0ABS1CM97_9GAMM|nr:hypothetical protein [Thiohalocapsa halophila]MBK1633047.1 hypothetical protein [Thiohalocapsa halophila]